MEIWTFRDISRNGAPLQCHISWSSAAVDAQGGMGEAAAEALRSIHSASGLDAARAFCRRLQKLPPVGGTFVHAVLDMEAAVPPAEQLPDAAMEAIFEVRAL